MEIPLADLNTVHLHGIVKGVSTSQKSYLCLLTANPSTRVRLNAVKQTICIYTSVTKSRIGITNMWCSVTLVRGGIIHQIHPYLLRA